MKLVAFLIALMAVSCSDSSSDSPRGDGKLPDIEEGDTRETYELNGKSPSQFYAQFYYKEGREQDERGEYDVFSYVRTDSQKVGETLDQDNQKCASFKLALNEDKTFIVNYEESYCLQSSARPHTWDPVFEKKLFGEWSIDKMDLKLGDFATATGFRLNGADSLRIQLLRDIHAEIANDTSFIGHYRENSVYPFDED